MSLDAAAEALRAARPAAAAVHTRRLGRPVNLWPAQLEELLFTPLGALYQPEEFERRKGQRHLLADWLAAVDPAKARALIDLDPPESDNGPGLLCLAFLDPEAAQWRHAVHGDRVLAPYAAAAALQWDVKAAAGILAEHDRLRSQNRAEMSAAFVGFQAFQLWNRPVAKPHPPEAMAPFLDRLSRAMRRTADRGLALRLGAQGTPLPLKRTAFDDALWAGEAAKALELIEGAAHQLAFVNRFAVEDPARARAALGEPDLITMAEMPALPALDAARAEKALAAADRGLVGFFLACWDPVWLQARWAPLAERLGDLERASCARILFERLLAAGSFDPALLDATRASWSIWAEALRTYARFKPEEALKVAQTAPAAQRVPTLQRILEGESDTRTFDVRLELLRKVAGEKHEVAVRAGLWLLLEEAKPWADEGRVLKAVEALGAVPVDAGWWRLLFQGADRYLKPALRKAIFARGK